MEKIARWMSADGIEVEPTMFINTDPKTMFAPRKADGSLPETSFLKARDDSPLGQRQMGW